MPNRLALSVVSVVATLTLVAAAVPSIGQTTEAAAVRSTPIAASAPTATTPLIHYSGIVVGSDGKPEHGQASITFFLFKDETGGEPLWAETQSVELDASGHYEVHLGARNPSGIPSDLFSGGEARWLDVQVAGGLPRPRVLMASVPYALKAADSATLGGLPASAFMLATERTGLAAQLTTPQPEASALGVTTTGGTAGYLPVFSGASLIGNSTIFETSGKVGINNAVPAANLDVAGSIAARGALTLESTGTATAAGGKSSQQLQFAASAYSSTSKGAIAPMFAFEAEAFDNNTATPASSLNLLFGNGVPSAETGLSISSKGIVKFAAGQTFPGVGTLTGITTTSPLVGGGTSGSVALSLNLTALESAFNARYPQLATANRFTGATTFTAPVTFAATQTFPGTGKGTLTGITTTSPLTGTGTTGTIALGLNLTALETTLNAKYPQLAVANKFTAATTFASTVVFASPVTFAATQTFPGIAGGGTITGITTASPLAGSGTKGSVALSLNLPALETTLNSKYAQLGAVNVFTQPITFAASQKFPGTTTITGVTAGTGLIGGGTTGAITLALDPKAIPTLTGSPVFTNSGNGVVGEASGTVLNTAGLLGTAGNRSGDTHIVAGVWGDSYQDVGVEGTSVQTVGVYGQSKVSYGMQGVSTTNYGVYGTSTSGIGVDGFSTSNSGVAGYTAGGTLNTAGTLGVAGSRTSFTGIAGVWGDAAQHVGVYGSSNLYPGVQGTSLSGPGLQGNSTSGNGVHGVSQNTSAIFGETSSTSGQDAGIFGYSHANGMGVYGASVSGPGVVGGTGSNIGVEGTAGDGGVGVRAIASTGSGVYASTTSGNAIYGSAQTGEAGHFDNNSNSSASLIAQNYAGWQGGGNAYPISVLGNSTGNIGVGVEGNSPSGIGILGIAGASDPAIHTNANIANRVVGVWGDTSGLPGKLLTNHPVNSYAVLGTAFDDTAGYFQNNSVNATVYAYNYYDGTGNTLYKTFVAATPQGICGFGGNGDLSCTGQVKSLATSSDGTKTVETYSMQSPENWMEDFGSGSLKNGSAMVTIEPAFAETVAASADYHVFLTPRGDSRGLYVTNVTGTGFEVRESGGGTSTLSFDYRIVAKRRGYERQRMTDVSEQVKSMRERIAVEHNNVTASSEQH
jgi:hypothetical protein